MGPCCLLLSLRGRFWIHFSLLSRGASAHQLPACFAALSYFSAAVRPALTFGSGLQPALIAARSLIASRDQSGAGRGRAAQDATQAAGSKVTPGSTGLTGGGGEIIYFYPLFLFVSDLTHFDLREREPTLAKKKEEAETELKGAKY